MLDQGDNATLPPIPSKRYFTIGEVSELCQVKPHVLRYWEQEFDQLNPVKRRGNRRYYQRHEVQLVRRIRSFCRRHTQQSVPPAILLAVVAPAVEAWATQHLQSWHKLQQPHAQRLHQ